MVNPRSSSAGQIPTLRSRIREATDAAILAAAEQVFAEQGLHEARMNDIAARAGVAVGTLYNHFKDREALLEGLIAVRRQQVLEVIDRALADDSYRDFRARVAGMLGAYFEYFAAHRSFYRIYLQGEMVQKQTCASTSQMAREIWSRLEKLARRGVREKALRSSSLDVFPALLMGALKAAWVREMVAGDDRPLDVAELTRCLLNGAGA
jgi:AcrR family transcriptional regulator